MPAQGSVGSVKRRLIGSTVIRQTAVLTASSISVSGMSAVATVLMARSLTNAQYGSYAFSLSFVMLLALLFEFGLYLPAARQIASAPAEDRPLVAGAALRLFIPIAVLFSACVLLSSLFVDRVFNVHAATALRVAAPLTFVYPATQLALLLAEGSGRLKAYSIAAAIGQAVALMLVVLLVALAALHSAATALIVRSAGLAVGWLVLARLFRPQLHNSRRYVSRILHDARRYGFNAYVGRVLSIGTYNMDVLMLAALRNATTVALYTLAGQLCQVGGQPVTALSSALFARSVGSASIPRQWIIASAGLGILSATALAIFGHTIVSLVFSSRYAQAAGLLFALALAQMLRGTTSIFNVYLSANGHGRELRNAALVLTASNVVFNVALIPPFGALGAAWASFLALAANLAAHVYWYLRVRAEGQSELTA